MDEYRFERFVADLWEEMGYRTTVRPPSRDAGIDVLARNRGPGGATEAIRAKRYEESTTVGGPEIRQYFAMTYQVGADEGLILGGGRRRRPAIVSEIA
ncbi:restriction endonuclease [Halobellus ruber]|uniref:Restriction endonuclease n=1 Tax=Halobellus ruber TaxID=2761102 RepID=A0A7J9SL41_9EURY|nr:restriction endonuclease [Halobellus ruber]MBB6647670.1 restriction endonuclease [Halobellus ruber]